MPSRTELVAHERDTSAIAEAIGADLVIFQTLPDLVAAVSQFNPDVSKFDCSVFNGEYVTGGVDEAYLQHIEKLRSDNAKSKTTSLNMLSSEPVNGVHSNGRDIDGLQEAKEVAVGCSGPLNGADDTVGLYNSFTSR